MGDASDFIIFLRRSIYEDDFPILVCAIGTFVVAVLVFISSVSVKKELETRPEKFSNRFFKNHNSMKTSDIRKKESILQRKRGIQTFLYTLYINAVSIFPLLGMLGTVKSLVELSAGMNHGEMVMNQFFKALSSTAWGMIFAIVFKVFIDPIISPQVSLNENDTELFLNRVSIIRNEALKEESEGKKE